MVAPLVVGALRVVAQKSAGTAARSRVARAATLTAEKSSSARFTQTQSLTARAAVHTKTSPATSPTQRISSRVRSRVAKGGLHENGSDTQDSPPTKKILGLATNIRLFLPLLPGLIAASIFIGLMGIMGLLSFFASELVSSLSFGFINVSSVGLLFVGLSFAGVVLSYSVMLIYLAVLKGLKPMTLTGIPFVAFVFLPVFDMVPGLNIFPCLILWAFLLCTVPQK